MGNGWAVKIFSSSQEPTFVPVTTDDCSQPKRTLVVSTGTLQAFDTLEGIKGDLAVSSRIDFFKCTRDFALHMFP